MRIFIFRKKTISLTFLGFLFCLGLCLNPVHLFQSVASPQKFKANSAKTAKVAVVIDDFGGYAAGINQMMTLPFPLTFAVMPFGEFARQQAEEAVAKGFEVIVHMPFEAVRADAGWYGKKYISAALSEPEIKDLIREAFHILPMATGLSNHMGSRATADPRVMQIVLAEIARQNRFFFDSKTAYDSPVARLNESLGLPHLERSLFLDDQNSSEQIRHQLNQLIHLARSRGFAIGIGHVGPSGPRLARILREDIPFYQKQGFQFVQLSEFINLNPVHKPFNSGAALIGTKPWHGGIDSGTKNGSQN